MGQRKSLVKNEMKKQQSQGGADRLGIPWEQDSTNDTDVGQVCSKRNDGSQESDGDGQRYRGVLRNTRKRYKQGNTKKISERMAVTMTAIDIQRKPLLPLTL